MILLHKSRGGHNKVMNFLKITLLVVNIALFICSIGFVLFGLVDQIFSPAAAEQLLKNLNIPLSYGWMIVVGTVCIVASALLHFARRKWFGA